MQAWKEAKKVFVKPDVTLADEIELEWKNPDVDGLVEFLVTEKGFKYVHTRVSALLPYPFIVDCRALPRVRRTLTLLIQRGPCT